MLQEANHSTGARFVNEGKKNSESSADERAFTFLSNAALYLIKQLKLSKYFIQIGFHVTCFAHEVHRLAEELKSRFRNLIKLISSEESVQSTCS